MSQKDSRGIYPYRTGFQTGVTNQTVASLLSQEPPKNVKKYKIQHKQFVKNVSETRKQHKMEAADSQKQKKTFESYQLKRFQNIPSKVSERIDIESSIHKQTLEMIEDGFTLEEALIQTGQSNKNSSFLPKQSRNQMYVQVKNREIPEPVNRKPSKKPKMPTFQQIKVQDEIIKKSKPKVNFMAKNAKRVHAINEISQEKVQQKQKVQKTLAQGLHSGENLAKTHSLGQRPNYLEKWELENTQKQNDEIEMKKQSTEIRVPIPETDRLFMLKQFKDERDDLLLALNQVPIQEKTYSVQRLREKLTRNLIAIENKINAFSKSVVIISMKQSEYEKRLKELGLKIPDFSAN